MGLFLGGRVFWLEVLPAIIHVFLLCSHERGGGKRYTSTPYLLSPNYPPSAEGSISLPPPPPKKPPRRNQSSSSGPSSPLQPPSPPPNNILSIHHPPLPSSSHVPFPCSSSASVLDPPFLFFPFPSPRPPFHGRRTRAGGHTRKDLRSAVRGTGHFFTPPARLRLHPRKGRIGRRIQPPKRKKQVRRLTCSRARSSNFLREYIRSPPSEPAEILEPRSRYNFRYYSRGYAHTSLHLHIHLQAQVDFLASPALPSPPFLYLVKPFYPLSLPPKPREADRVSMLSFSRELVSLTGI